VGGGGGDGVPQREEEALNAATSPAAATLSRTISSCSTTNSASQGMIGLENWVAFRLCQRDGEYKQRSHLRGFCHRGVDAGRHSCKTTVYKSTDSPLPPLLNVMYCVRVSLWTVKKILCATLKRRGPWVISVYLWVLHSKVRRFWTF
jgi:hypothetical protein